ncbi:hypothetical protein SUGI_0182850 [Cryptomeria japonica]|uniref:probable histone acetyltransferase HAC-like 1 n=1 Tax=Cryptomeria japonica TaxID=3369 RepID=UPI002408BD51|nr:probable histone acetyltransferase HAC-like 1 [Cryptomeria japonica]GLJ12049.1 hypothetical protein SUGI_0182850 [Cryptomeria japonica]
MPGRPLIPGQVSGHVTGQVGGQLPGLAQQNGSSLASQTSNHGGMRRSWHTDVDVPAVRRHIIERILQIFQRHPISPEWQQRLPEFVRRLEDALFTEAASKEEYMDSTSLERRLQILVRRFQPPNNRNQNRTHHNPPPVGQQ